MIRRRETHQQVLTENKRLRVEIGLLTKQIEELRKT